MHYPLFIGLRYLRAKRTEAFISLITIIAITGVAVGVMTLDIVLSVMTGFEEDLRDRILGFNPHVLVSSFTGNVSDYPAILEQVRAAPDVVDATPFVYGQAMLSSAETVAGVLVRGVVSGPNRTIDLAGHVTKGNIDELTTRHTVSLEDVGGATVELPGIILGTELARQLGVGLGEPVTVVSPIGLPTAIGIVPRVKRFALVGLFDSGMVEYNSALAYISLPEAQRFFQLDDSVSGIEVRVTDLYRAREVAAALSTTLGFPYRIRDWMEVNHNLFSALKLEKTVYFIVLLLIVLVAAFNIVATLFMVVMEKRKDIAVLKSMGATRAGIAQIFVLKGLLIGGVGTLLGSVAGFAVCWALHRYELIELPKDVFYVSTLPVKMYPEYFLIVVGASLAICLLATIYPARQAARLAPVDVIRYE